VDHLRSIRGRDVKTGLELTFDFLARTRNDAAVLVLVAAMASPLAEVRRRAARAILRRESAVGTLSLVEHWEQLEPEERALAGEDERRMTIAVNQILQNPADRRHWQAIACAAELKLQGAAIPLIDCAEFGAVQVRQRALDVVLAMAVELGRSARHERDAPTHRIPIIERLSDAVRRWPTHRIDMLLDAFLACVRWEDGVLLTMLAEPEPPQDILLMRMLRSPIPEVVQLLAGWARKRRIPDGIVGVLRQRQDALLRDELLSIASDPSSGSMQTTMQVVGVPNCIRPTDNLLASLDRIHWPAAVRLVFAGQSDGLRQLVWLLTAIESDDEPTVKAATALISQVHRIDPEVFIRGAVELGQPDASPSADVVARMLRLLRRDDLKLKESIRHLLAPLHIDALLPRLESLRMHTRRMLGRVSRQVDPDALQRITDQLRHPVLTRRLAAIDAIVALQATDELVEPLSKLIESDFDEARERAIIALGSGRGPATRQVLERLEQQTLGHIHDAVDVAIASRSLQEHTSE
jgi:hypothetical protein